MRSMEEAVSLGNIEGVEFKEIAERYDTPCYVYSAELIAEASRRCLEAVAPIKARLSYAVKANSNLSVLNLIRNEGLGFDAASVVEMARVLHWEGTLKRTILTGPGKSAKDIFYALEHGIAEIVCDSEGELERVIQLASAVEERVSVGVRLNIDIDAGTHPHVATGLRNSKFGVPKETARRMFEAISGSQWLQPGSVNVHIGSQIASSAPYIEAAKELLSFREELVGEGIEPACIDLGGGFGIGEVGARPQNSVLAELVGWLAENAPGVQFGFQPGRMIVGEAGILLARVEYRKPRHLIVDAAMTELLRPALYGSRHGVAHIGGDPAGPGDIDIVGPVCENADFLVKGVDIDAVPGELIALFDAGAYGSSMGSEYNGRLRPCSVMVAHGRAILVRQRESIEESMAHESKVKTPLLPG